MKRSKPKRRGSEINSSAPFDPKVFGDALVADKYLVAVFLGCSPGSLSYKVKNRSLPAPTLWDGRRLWHVETLVRHFRNLNRLRTIPARKHTHDE